MNKAKKIECVISPKLSILLDNVVEVYGHDDSLPFNADVFVYDTNDETGCFHKIAIAYNDGWGGQTEINPTQSRYQQQLDYIDDVLRTNYEVAVKMQNSEELKWDVTLEYLISCMAAYCIDGNVRKMSVLQLQDCKFKK